MVDIFLLSVEEMASKIKNGQLTSVEVCEKYIERIKYIREYNFQNI